MKQRIVLYADEGKILTDGTNYGKTVYLETGLDGSAYYEITDAEYAEIVAAEEAEANMYEHN